VNVVREELAAAGRVAGFGPGEFPIAKRVYVGIDQADSAQARERMNTALANIYGHRVPAIEAAAVTGTAAEVAAGVRAVIDAGAEMILVTPLWDLRGHMELGAAEGLPAL